MTVTFKGAGKLIEDSDLPRVGHEIGVGEDVIHALIDVESGGRGFDKQGRIKILFEPHLFFRNLASTPHLQREAVRQGLAYPNWKRSYPADSYPRLLSAMKIREEAALWSTSYGLGQIIGSNYKLAGYASVYHMIEDFADDEDNHLEAMISFIKSANLATHLRAIEHRLRNDGFVTSDICRPFVRGYNGPAYEKNAYHIKFANAVNRWAKIPDTPWTPSRAEPVPVPVAEAMHHKVGPAVKRVQLDLIEMGYHEVGAADGKWGGKTAGALAAFMNDRHLEGDVAITSEVIDEIEAAKIAGFTRPIAPERAQASEEKVAEKVPELKEVKKGKAAALWTTITAGAGSLVSGIADNFDQGVTWVGRMQGYFDDVPGWAWLLLVAVIAGAVWYYNSKGATKIVHAFRTGERN